MTAGIIPPRARKGARRQELNLQGLFSWRHMASADHLLHYRPIKSVARHIMMIERSKLAEWVEAAAANTLQPLRDQDGLVGFSHQKFKWPLVGRASRTLVVGSMVAAAMVLGRLAGRTRRAPQAKEILFGDRWMALPRSRWRRCLALHGRRREQWRRKPCRLVCPARSSSCRGRRQQNESEQHWGQDMARPPLPLGFRNACPRRSPGRGEYLGCVRQICARHGAPFSARREG